MANGWLSPDGEFFPCDIGKHHDQAKQIIADYPETWEADCWIQITPTAAFSEKGATAAQIEWLENSGSWLYRADAEILRQIGKERVMK